MSSHVICETSAPGKVMIAGEYSVLCNGYSIAAAVNRHARCFFKLGGSSSFYAKAPELISADDSALILACLRACDEFAIDIAPGSYLVDTSQFFCENGTRKLGLGSSAAAATALCKMILRQGGIEDRQSLFDLASRAHAIFSSDLGSGVDVATSAYADAIWFSKKPNEPIITIALKNYWSNIIFIDTGRSQDTRDFVKKIMAFQQANPSAFSAFVQRSDALCQQIRDGHDDLANLIQALEELYQLLAALGKASGIDITSDVHREIHDIAYRHAGTAKPSGAGGGDLALAVIPREQQDNFVDGMAERGFVTLPLAQIPR